MSYIKLNRKFFDNFLWKEARQYSKAEAWLDLISSARFEASTELVNGHAIEVQRGEIPASRRFLEERWKWGNTKVTNFLKMLRREGMITQRMVHGITVIVLVNYDFYNKANHQTSHQTNHEQTTTKPTNTTDTKKQQTTNQTTNAPPNKPTANQWQTNGKPNRIKDNKFKKDNKGKKGATLSLPYHSEKFIHAWETLLTTPKWKKKVNASLQLSLNKIAKYDEEFAIELIENATAGGWQGIVFPDTDEKFKKWKKQNTKKQGVNALWE
jgi:hypothetical protein